MGFFQVALCLIAVVVGFAVVPLPTAPDTAFFKFHNEIGLLKGGIWGGMDGPYRLSDSRWRFICLRNYMVGLPRECIENAKVERRQSDFTRFFVKIILRFSCPRLWLPLPSPVSLEHGMDWLVALVFFLIDSTGETTVIDQADC